MGTTSYSGRGYTKEECIDRIIKLTRKTRQLSWWKRKKVYGEIWELTILLSEFK